MAVAAMTKNAEISKATASNFKSISGSMILSITDLYGNGLRLKVLYFLTQINFYK